MRTFRAEPPCWTEVQTDTVDSASPDGFHGRQSLYCVVEPGERPLPFAAHAQTQSAAKGDPRIEVASRIPGAKPEDLRATPVPNIYELTRGSEIGYVTADGKYAFGGDLVDLREKR